MRSLKARALSHWKAVAGRPLNESPLTPMFFLITAVLFGKLMLSHATLGYRLGVMPPVTYLKMIWVALSYHSAAPLVVGHYLVNLGTALLLTAPLLALPRRAQRRAFLIVDVLATIWLLSDTIYFRYFHDFLSASVLLNLGMTGQVAPAISRLLRWSDLLFIADFAALGGVALFRRGWTPAPLPETPRFRRLVVTGCALVLGGVATWFPVARSMSRSSGDFENEWSSLRLYQVTGLLPVHLLRMEGWLRDHVGNPVPAQSLAKARSWFAHRPPEEETPLFGVAKGLNVIMVQIEAFQDLLIGRSIHGVEVTPNLNRLVGQSLYFPNLMHQTSVGRTSDAEFATNCSLLHLRAGSVYTRFPDNHFDCLAGRLRALGYQTLALHGGEGSNYNRYRVYPRMGFDRFLSKDDFHAPGTVGMGIGDGPFLLESAEKLRQVEEPFFAFLITLSTHYPFELGSAAPAILSPYVKSNRLGHYLDAVHYTDSAIGQWVEALRRSGLWDRSVVIFYGDHDTGMDPDDLEPLFGHPLTDFERGMARFRVGSWIHFPKDALAGVEPRYAGQADLAPSVMHMVGAPGGAGWMGEDLLSKHPGLVSLRDGSFVDQQFFGDLSEEAGATGCFELSTRLGTDGAHCRSGIAAALEVLEVSRALVFTDGAVLSDMRAKSAPEQAAR